MCEWTDLEEGDEGGPPHPHVLQQPAFGAAGQALQPAQRAVRRLDQLPCHDQRSEKSGGQARGHYVCGVRRIWSAHLVLMRRSGPHHKVHHSR